MKRCESERRELRTELRKFGSHEGELKRFFTYQKRQEKRLTARKLKVEDAANFAEIMAAGQPALRRRLYQRALKEYQDEELISLKDEQIEAYLNREFLEQEHLKFGKRLKKPS